MTPTETNPAAVATGRAHAPASAPGRSDPRVLIVAENASEKFGGESILPLHYFRFLRRRGAEAWMIAHDRTRRELSELLPGEAGRIFYVPDGGLDRLACRVSPYLPKRLNDLTFTYAGRLKGLLHARGLARRLVPELGIDVVHQPIPVSPREPSVLHGLGAPVVIGPMNGGMSYPPAFRELDGRATGAIFAAGRAASGVLNRLMPGKRRAEVLLVANERTRRALPKGCRGAVETVVENGVDLAVWDSADGPSQRPEGAEVKFLFLGRLVDGWKGVDLLLDALSAARARTPATLEIVGEGPLRGPLERQAQALGLGDSVRFSGWVPQRDCARKLREADALVLPSLYECGGAVVLEAMACARPVIATNWGGPADYLDASCGILVEPATRDSFVTGLADAMVRLAESPRLREDLGRAGRERVVREFDWERKVDRVLEIYGQAVALARPTRAEESSRGS